MGKYRSSVWTEYIHLFFNYNHRRRKLKSSTFLRVIAFIAISCHLFQPQSVDSRPIDDTTNRQDVGDQNLTSAMVRWDHSCAMLNHKVKKVNIDIV